MKKKLVMIIILLVIGIIGVTYAVYTWAISLLITGTAECFEVNYVKGQDIGSDSNSRTLIMSEDYIGGLFASVSVSTDSNSTINNAIGT